MLKLIDFIGTASKYVTNILLVVALITTLVLFFRYYTSTFKFLNKYGLTRIMALSVAVMCRKDWVNNTRLFMEYAIFAIKGQRVDRKKWKKIILEFYSKYIKALDKTNIIELNSTFELANENVKCAIGEYFEHISQKRFLKRFAVDISKPLFFISELEIRQGYMVPLAPILSLQDRYKQDWSQILSKYVRTISKNESINSTELFALYNWLMWGPSVQLDCGDDDYKLCEYGLGDEAMALSVALTDSQKSMALWNEIKSSSIQGELGRFLKGSFKVCEVGSYINSRCERFGASYAPFCDFLTSVKSDTAFILQLEDYEINTKLNNSEYIFSAYIWIMLHYTDSNNIEFDTARTLALCEHANIADSGNVNFLKKRLIDKIITHLESVWENPEYNERKYSVIWALNDALINDFKDKVDRLIGEGNYKYANSLKERLVFESNIPVSTILSKIDLDFCDSELNIVHRHIDFENTADLGLLGRFYCELYLKEFPDINERESLDNILNQAKRLKNNPAATYYCTIALRGNKIVGGVIGDYFKKSNCGIIEFIVVDRSERGNRIGRNLLNALFDKMNEQARQNGHSEVNYCFLEVEKPMSPIGSVEREKEIHRLGFWHRIGAKNVNINYVQPALQEGKEPVSHLLLNTIICNNMLDKRFISKKDLATFIRDYFKNAINVIDVSENSFFMSLADDEKNSKIELISLYDFMNS